MKNRLKAPLKQWIKFAVVALIIILFAVWLWNFWVLLLLPVAFDLYITKFVKWDWWKKIKNPHLRTVFEWGDAIIFALVAVYFINLYLFQNYKIPSSSLEKTLLVGDHLFVSKVAYGPRTPVTPLSFPLVQHTFPIINTKSYIESVQWKSRRLAGLGEVQRNDIVVFNFPAGDTVALNKQAADYEGLCYEAGRAALPAFDSIFPAWKIREMSFNEGRKILKENPEIYGKIIYRPVDRRENYVKRCVGLPGDTLEIREREIFIDGKKQPRPAGVQNYCEIVSSQALTQTIYDNLEISRENYANALKGIDSANDYHYVIPLTLQNQADLRRVPFIKSVTELTAQGEQTTFPAGYNPKWTVDNYGPIYIPKAGATVKISVENLPLYERIIRNYEGNKLEVKDDKVFVNDKETNSYTFRMNYYWMMGDNRHNSADSRSWGFVPEDHIVGKPIFVWLSLNPDKGLFSGGIRWNRFFKYAGK
ncbi:MAG: S26 family signal peptidase [Prevotellaceae bacterium]|nr:S26 family signal peptidase [Prevotellaceae bacterium]